MILMMQIFIFVGLEMIKYLHLDGLWAQRKNCLVN